MAAQAPERHLQVAVPRLFWRSAGAREPRAHRVRRVDSRHGALLWHRDTHGRDIMFHPDQASTRRWDMGETFVAVMVALNAVAVVMSIEPHGPNWQITEDVLEHVFTIGLLPGDDLQALRPPPRVLPQRLERRRFQNAAVRGC